jgi:hypothetical protein
MSRFDVSDEIERLARKFCKNHYGEINGKDPHRIIGSMKAITWMLFIQHGYDENKLKEYIATIDANYDAIERNS